VQHCQQTYWRKQQSWQSSQDWTGFPSGTNSSGRKRGYGYEDDSDKKNKATQASNDKFGLVFPEDSFGQRIKIMKQFGLK